MTTTANRNRQAFGHNIRKFLVWAGVVLLQLFLTQFVTFFAAFLFPSTGDPVAPLPTPFVIALGLTLSAGVILGGLAAIKFHWVAVKPKLAMRSAGALIGAYIPLILALLIYRPIEPGNPLFLVSVITSVLCFWIIR